MEECAAFLPAVFCHLGTPFCNGSARELPVCSLTPQNTQSWQDRKQVTGPGPFGRSLTAQLLSRMVDVAVRSEDFVQAAALRDAHRQVLMEDPLYRLQRQLEVAVRNEKFALAADLSHRIDHLVMIAAAENCKPRFPTGLVAVHRRLGYRMLLFDVDHRCLRQCASRACEVEILPRGWEQPWYHAAVDEREKRYGHNILYVAEDDCIPCPGPGYTVQHPIADLLFAGFANCPKYSRYIPAVVGK